MRKSVNYQSSVIRRLSSDHFHSGVQQIESSPEDGNIAAVLR
jgi:hypothetical protein